MPGNLSLEPKHDSEKVFEILAGNLDYMSNHQQKNEMKKTMICLYLLMSGSLLFAQYAHVAPDQVQQSFHKDYPAANNARWSQIHGQWHANFTDQGPNDNGEMIAHYDRNGRHIESHIPYDQNDVPAPVMERLNMKYRGAHHYRFTRIEHSDGNEYFQIRLNSHGRDRTVYMDEQGHERQYDGRH